MLQVLVDEESTAAVQFPPTIKSYHMHILYVGEDKKQVAMAREILDEYMKEFNVTNLCEWLFGQGGKVQEPCIFPMCKGPDGPFVGGQWAVYVPVRLHTEYSQWFTQHRRSLDLLIHPNSGWEKDDHQKWGVWGGNVWPLNLSIFGDGPDPANYTTSAGSCPESSARFQLKQQK